MKERLNATASRAFAQLRSDSAEEFETLPAFAGRLRELSDIQRDVAGTISEIGPKVVPDRDNDQRWGVVALLNGRKAPLREHAFDQLCAMIGFPSKALVRCPQRLAAENLAYFSFMEGNRKALARLENNEVRAVLGAGYESVNHLEIVHRLIESRTRLEVNYAGLSARRMFVLAVDPESKYEGPDGSQMSHCTLVGNSETGEGSFFAQDLWFDHI